MVSLVKIQSFNWLHTGTRIRDECGSERVLISQYKQYQHYWISTKMRIVDPLPSCRRISYYVI